MTDSINEYLILQSKLEEIRKSVTKEGEEVILSRMDELWYSHLSDEEINLINKDFQK